MRISDWSSDVCSSDLFKNRYGTSLYGEIVLPKRAAVPPSDGPFPVILALEGVNTNVAMYRWWHQAFADAGRSEEHTSELQSLMRISYAVFCLKKKKTIKQEPRHIVSNDRSAHT